MTKWVLLIHGDSDGVCSGALFYHYIVNKGSNAHIVFTHPAGLANDLQEFTDNGDNIFIADIALSESHLEEIHRILGERSRYGEVIYIDHHPEPLEKKLSDLPHTLLVHDTCCSASELVYKYLFENGLDEEYSRVALYGAIGDYLDNTPWVRKALWDWDKRHIYYEAGVLIQGLEGSRRLYDFKRRVVKLLADNKLPSSDEELLIRALFQSRRDEELRIWVRKHVETYHNIAYVANPPGSIGRAANYARVYGDKPVGLAYETRNTKLVMSLRSIEGIDLNIILRKIVKKLDGSGGGHPTAAGARIDRELFNSFLEELDKYIISMKFHVQ